MRDTKESNDPTESRSAFASIIAENSEEEEEEVFGIEVRFFIIIGWQRFDGLQLGCVAQ